MYKKVFEIKKSRAKEGEGRSFEVKNFLVLLGISVSLIVCVNNYWIGPLLHSHSSYHYVSKK
jgi:hypothetical protein